jgi:D-serine deaminase-like pyridoxal phosphate-dependent protein
MPTQQTRSRTLTHEQAVKELNALMAKMKEARELCGARLDDAFTAAQPTDRTDAALWAADKYARDLVLIVDEMDKLRQTYPRAWRESEAGQAERHNQQLMQQAILDAAIMALGGRWPNSMG